MLASLARKTFDLYTAPARYAFRQSRRNLDRLRLLRNNFAQRQRESDQALDQLLALVSQRLGIDTAAMSRAERLRHARNALANAEYGLSLALRESLKALVLFSLDDRESRRQPAEGQVIDGECQRLR